MLSYMAEIASQVAVLFLLIAVGFILFKTGGIKSEHTPGMVTLLLYAITPALIIDSMLKVEFNLQTVTEMITVLLIALAVHVLGWLISLAMFRRQSEKKAVVYRAAVILSNAGFMSIPLATALVGAKGTFLVSVYVIMFNLFTWTVVYRMFNHGRISVKKMLLNPGIIAFAVGLVFFLSGIKLPDIVTSAVEYIASMNTPLAMVVIGVMIAAGGMKLKKEEMPSAILSISCRLLTVPLIALGVMVLCGIEPEIIFIVMIPICAPTAANTAMFAAKFGKDDALASKLLAVSTVFSIVTMSVILAFTKWVVTLI